MGKDRERKREKRRLRVRAEMVKRDITMTNIAGELGISLQAVSKGCDKVPRIIEALVAAGVPRRVFGEQGRAA